MFTFTAFTHYLHSEGWSVDTHLEDLSHAGGPIEDIDGTNEEREAVVLDRLKALSEDKHKRALILMNSHIGGHKFAGNVIVRDTNLNSPIRVQNLHSRLHSDLLSPGFLRMVRSSDAA